MNRPFLGALKARTLDRAPFRARPAKKYFPLRPLLIRNMLLISFSQELITYNLFNGIFQKIKKK